MSRIVPVAMTNAWKSQAKIGDQRPVIRATIQVQNMKRFNYDTAWANGGTWETDRHRTGTFASFIFGDSSPLREIPNIKSCSWERSVGQDAATCTLTLMNAEMTPIGAAEANPDPDELDNPGWLTYNRGNPTVDPNPWGYEANGWRGILVPDRVVRTYEGYSADYTAFPAQDENLLQSGTWMIDSVTYGADGTITLEMRDLARLLLDQVVFPPAVPMVEYPLSWKKFRSENVPGRDAQGGSWLARLARYGTAKSSNQAYVGLGLTNVPRPHYVTSTGGVEGHADRHPILKHYVGDGDDIDPTAAEKEKDYETYWLSTGQDSPSSYVWWEWRDKSGTTPVAGVRLRMHGGPFRVFISVHDGTKWRGKKKIPWKKNGKTGSPGNVEIGANIPFVKSVIADRYNQFDVILPRKYRAKRIRLTFTRLQHWGVGEHPYRAGLREFKIYTNKNYNSLHFGPGEFLKVTGNYGDYNWIVKWVLAWSGWYWPPHSTGLDFIRQHSDATAPNAKEFVSYVQPDPAMPVGRVWGDIMRTYTSGVADLTVDMFDKKPMMEIIGYVRDLTGFLFFIDEAGGAVFRQPNLWKLGNYASPERVAGDGDSPHVYSGRPGKRGRGERTSTIVEIKDDETLLDYETKLDSSNIRERIFVANAVGGMGTVIRGFNPYDVGLARVAGWCVDTDTQIFTQRGWLNYDEVKAGDQTLSINEETGMSEWQVIREVAVFPATERDMVEIKSETLSAVTTANHRWLVKNNGRWKWRTSETLVANDRIPRALPRADAPEIAIYDDSFVDLVAWAFTEGCISKGVRGRARISIYQSIEKNPEKCEMIRTSLRQEFGDSGWSESKPRRAGEVAFGVSANNSVNLLSVMDDSKAPSMEFLMSLTREQLDRFVKVCILGDGWQRKTSVHSKNDSRFFAQQVGPRLDAFLAACALAGEATTWQEMQPDEFANNYTKKPKASVTLHRSRLAHPVSPDGLRGPEATVTSQVVWCPSMPNHHTWLARRNGSVYFTGNTDQNFATKRETVVMADMISARAMFTYKTAQLTIPGYPKIQVDDQIRIFERVTNETYYHYVMGIKSEINMEDGTWLYNLSTHWLGERPEDAWVVDVEQLSGVTKQYLAAIGYAPNGAEDKDD